MRLIDANIVIKAFDISIEKCRAIAGDSDIVNVTVNMIEDCRDFIAEVPTVDAVPVRRGEWLISSDGYYPYCSECGHRPDKMSHFCPECGSDMRGDNSDAG